MVLLVLVVTTNALQYPINNINSNDDVIPSVRYEAERAFLSVKQEEPALKCNMGMLV